MKKKTSSVLSRWCRHDRRLKVTREGYVFLFSLFLSPFGARARDRAFFLRIRLIEFSQYCVRAIVHIHMYKHVSRYANMHVLYVLDVFHADAATAAYTYLICLWWHGERSRARSSFRHGYTCRIIF